MTVKHGNWNAYQKTEEEIQRDERERRHQKSQAVIAAARRMFDEVCEAPLNENERLAAYELLGVLLRRNVG